MFVRKKPNKSGSITVQIIDKSSGKYNVVRTVGTSSESEKIDFFFNKAHRLIPELLGQSSLDLVSQNDKTILNFLKHSDTIKIRVIGPELIFGKLFDEIGFN